METNTPSPRPTQALLKVFHVAASLNISRALAFQLLQQGKIRSVRITGAVRVRPADLERYIEENLTPKEK